MEEGGLTPVGRQEGQDVHPRPILLFVSYDPVLSSLQFALSLDGLVVKDGAAGGHDPSAACCLVIDQRFRGDGLAFLAELRERGCTAPAIFLATNPNKRTRCRAAAAGAVVIEKPLLGDELARSLHMIAGGAQHA